MLCIHHCGYCKCNHRRYQTYHEYIVRPAYQLVLSRQHDTQLVNIFYQHTVQIVTVGHHGRHGPLIIVKCRFVKITEKEQIRFFV